MSAEALEIEERYAFREPLAKRASIRVCCCRWCCCCCLQFVTASTCAFIFYGPSHANYEELVESLPNLHGKCVAITGTTSGTGYHAAVAAVRKQASCVFLLNRESKRAIAASQTLQQHANLTRIVNVSCDLQSFDSVRQAAGIVNKIAANFGGLDVLALNAGVMDFPDERTADGFDVQMQTNHLSHFLLTKLLMPSFGAALSVGREVRVVTHSSVARSQVAGGPMNTTYYAASAPNSLGGKSGKRERYHQTKLANALFAMALYNRTKGKQRFLKFKALAAAPGVALTNLNLNSFFKVFAQTAEAGTCPLLTAMFASDADSGDFYEPSHLFFGPAIKVIAAGEPQARGILWRAMKLDDADICSTNEQDMMWSASEKSLGERFTLANVASVNSSSRSDQVEVN